MTEHERMIDKLWRKPRILANALKVKRLWIRAKEYPIDRETQECADLVFQDRCISTVSPDTTCFVLELKSQEADHEVVGQLEKAVIVLEKIGDATRHWEQVRGVAIAKEFTKSGLSLLDNKGYVSFEWKESGDKVRLRQVGDPKYRPRVKRKAVVFLKGKKK